MRTVYRFCRGWVAYVGAGLVVARSVDSGELQRLADKIARARKAKK
jgi:hypothetical protein